jgi:fatty acid desaturase
MALFCVVLPELFCAFFIWWESYAHHLNVPTSSAYDASVTVLDGYHNWESFNIGHHTAHHEKPTLHWSLLPQRTEAIAGRIPAACIRGSYRRSARPAVEIVQAGLGEA